MAARPESGSNEAGVIRAGEMYTLEEAKRRIALGDWAWRQMRRDGLRILRKSGRAYVLGDDLIDYMRGQGDQAQQQRKEA